MPASNLTISTLNNLCNIPFVTWGGNEVRLADVVAGLSLKFQDVIDAEGQHEIVTTQKGIGRLQTVETAVTLHRPAQKSIEEKTAAGNKKKVEVPGPTITLRLAISRVVDELGLSVAEWLLLSNAKTSQAEAVSVARWYAWRWRIESCHNLFKSAGLNAEEWQQERFAAFLRRQMAHKVESAAPALLAGLEKLLAIDDLLQGEVLGEILALVRKMFPTLFRSA